MKFVSILKDSIKPDQESNDNDTPLLLIVLGRETNVTNGSEMAFHGFNGIPESEDSHTTGANSIENRSLRSNVNLLRANVNAAGKNPSRQTRKSRIANAEQTRKGSRSKKLKDHKCPHCAYATNRSDNLRKHIRTHTGEKPYQCNQCSKRFSDPSHYNKHLKVHAKEFPLQCSPSFRGFSGQNKKDPHEMACKKRRLDSYFCSKTLNDNKVNVENHL